MKRVVVIIPLGALVFFAGAVIYLASRQERSVSQVRMAPEPSPEPAQAKVPDSIPTIAAETLKRRLDAGEKFELVFVGNHHVFKERHIPGAYAVPYGELEKHFAPKDRAAEFILYCGCCGGASEGVSGMAVQRLREMGFRNVSHLYGHFAEWQRMGYAVGGANPGAIITERAYANEKQREELEAFQAEVRARREEILAVQAVEKDPVRRTELDAWIRDVDRMAEIRGFLLKRVHAEANGDAAKIRDIDRLIDLRVKALEK